MLGAGVTVRESWALRGMAVWAGPADARLGAPRTKGVRRKVIAEPAGERVTAVGSKETHCSMAKRPRLWFFRAGSV